MGDVADRLDRLRVRVCSPDRQLAVTVSGYEELLEIELPAAVYRRYDDRALARQLEQLARLTHVAFRREHRAITEEVFRRPFYDDMVDLVGPQLRAYRQRV